MLLRQVKCMLGVEKGLEFIHRNVDNIEQFYQFRAAAEILPAVGVTVSITLRAIAMAAVVAARIFVVIFFYGGANGFVKENRILVGNVKLKTYYGSVPGHGKPDNGFLDMRMPESIAKIAGCILLRFIPQA